MKHEGSVKTQGWWGDVLHHPRRVWLRKAMFQIHLWCGLAAGLLATVAGVTGSAVVYRKALDRRLAPELYRVQAGAAIPADEVLSRLRKELPGFTVVDLDIQSGASPWVFRVVSPSGARETAYVDAADGRLLGVRGERQGLMNWLDALHTELLGGRVGTYVNGFGATGLLLLCMTGIVVWWPGRGHLRRAVRIRVPGRWRRFNWDLHTAGGFWIVVPLAVEAFSGVFLCFGLSWMVMLFGERQGELESLLSNPEAVARCAVPGMSVEAALARVRGMHLGAEDTFVELPQPKLSTLTVFSRTATEIETGRVAVTAFDLCSGAVIKDVDSRTASRALQTALWLDAFHFGLVGGSVTKVAWVGLGLTPGVLFVTGFLMWWRRVLARRLRGAAAESNERAPASS